MLPGSKADGVAIRGEECRMTQTAEIPSRLHKHRIVRGFQIMRPDKLSVNSGWQFIVTNDTQSVVNAWSQGTRLDATATLAGLLGSASSSRPQLRTRSAGRVTSP